MVEASSAPTRDERIASNGLVGNLEGFHDGTFFVVIDDHATITTILYSAENEML